MTQLIAMVMVISGIMIPLPVHEAFGKRWGQAAAMAKLAAAIISGEGMEEIEFEDDRYISALS